MRSNKENIQETVLEVEILERQSVMEYRGDKKQRFIKITMALPKLLAPAKRILEKEIIMNEFDFQDCRAFENNVDIDIRFMVDLGVVGCSWIQIPAKSYTIRTSSSKPFPESRSQLEIDVAFDKFIAHEPEGEWAKVAPFRILSFDIECAGRRGIFPEAKIDPVIQIANMVIRQECAPIVGSQILCYEREE
uniref:DNA polymerase delta catalytic subunit n=1 Tax=Megaselia scalaris TaxID=36166 RepID=T1GKA7_MEGSC